MPSSSASRALLIMHTLKLRLTKNNQKQSQAAYYTLEVVLKGILFFFGHKKRLDYTYSNNHTKNDSIFLCTKSF